MIWGKQERRGEAGLTMVELMVAIAVSALIVVSSLVLMTYMITAADDNRDKTMATLEVQYVGFWINEDVVQAQTINVGNISGDVDGFPLIIEWTKWDGSRSEKITYKLEPMEDDENLRRLIREREVYQDGEYDFLQSGTSLVAEYLVPWDDAEDTGTRVCRMVYSTDYDEMKSLIVEVAARADRSEASSTYEIYPRAVVDWHPQDVDSHYAGPECQLGS